MTKFEPSYARVEDIEWTCSFTWSQRGEVSAPLASPFTDSQGENNDALSGLEDAMVADGLGDHDLSSPSRPGWRGTAC